MSSLLPTNRALVVQADALFADGHVAKARRLCEEIVQRAQESVDRVSEAEARALLARCLLRVRDADGAREQLVIAARIADPGHVELQARIYAARARLALDDGPKDAVLVALTGYRRWSSEQGHVATMLDAALLSGPFLSPGDRVGVLEAAIDAARRQGDGEEGVDTVDLGRAYGELAGALDQVGQGEEALVAYRSAELVFRRMGRVRECVACGWAAGALACRQEDWPLARTLLEAAVQLAQGNAACDDLVALALADLASVYDAAGDVVEARRLLLRAISSAREHHLGTYWPERWEQLVAMARRLELA